MDGQYEIQYFVSDLQNQSNSSDIISPIEDLDRTNDSASVSQQYLVSIPTSLDQIAAENLIYMAQDGQVCNDQIVTDAVQMHIEESECHIVEEVITATDWVQQQGEDRVEIPVDEICASNIIESDDLEVPLPTDQDQYTTLRPYPCDFCSRRFRKKISLTNHMVAHQNDRPHICKLCGARYFHRNDLMNHLKMHPQEEEDCSNSNFFFSDLNIHEPQPAGSSAQSGDHYYDQDWKFDEIEEKPKPRSNGRKKKKIKEEIIYDVSTQEKECQASQPMQYSITDPKRPFVCQECGIAFTREKAYISHTRIHANDNIFDCKSCSETFWDINALNEHQKIHQFEASNSEYEPENENDNENENENDNDTFSDNDSKYAEFYCHICGMSFHRHDLLERHSKQHIKIDEDDKSALHCCSNCSQTFVEALDLLAHAEVHTRYRSFKCFLCGKSFFEEAAIKKHVTSVHPYELTENSCILCGKECRDRKALIKHSWDHSREKYHSCSKCGKNFHNKARLKRHMASHRDKSVICDVCQKEFPDGRTLSNHRHSHSNAAGKQFPCNECGKTFGSRSSQQIHIRIHTGERPYGCRFCWKAFADGGTLRKHERIHTGEKPYECSVCPRAFNQRVVLRDHIRSHHSSIDEKCGTYRCSVCQEDQQSSAELIKHLIHHSDQNTAMQRQPVTGPRKYKRRRKLKPHEIDRLKTDKLSSDIDYSDYDVGTVDDILGIQGDKADKNVTSSDEAFSLPINTENGRSTSDSEKITNSWQSKVNSDDSFKTLMASLENSLHSIEPLIASRAKINSSSSLANIENSKRQRKRSERSKNEVKNERRPKMIHTQKTRVVNDYGKHKTKTMITRTEPTEMDVFPQRHRDTSDFDVITPDLLPPNKIACSPVRNKQDTLSITEQELYKAQLHLEANSMQKELEKYNPSVVNELVTEEILCSPKRNEDSNKSIDANDHDLRRSTRSRRCLPNRKYLEFETSLPSLSRQKQPKTEDTKFSCDMCAAVFPDRSQLLVHVHVHI